MNTINDTTPKSLSEELVNTVIVADTSALLIRGTDLLRSLPDSTLVIPAIVVSELEGKRTSANVGFLAREWLRLLESMRSKYGIKLAEGVKIDESFGVKSDILLRIEPNHTDQQSLPVQLRNGSNDSTILAVAVNLEKDEAIKDRVVLISNDVPMRIHSTLEINIDAYEISSATIDEAKPFSGVLQVKLTDEELADLNSSKAFYGNLVAMDDDEVLEEASHGLIEVVTETDSQIMGIKTPNGLVNVKGDLKVSRIIGKTLEQKVAMQYLLESSSTLPIVSVGGNAGTGKTLLTVAAGLDEVKRGKYQKVLVFRSLHEMGVGQEMGFLPGDVDAKIAPWAGAIYDAVDVIARKKVKSNNRESIEAEVGELKEMIEVSPITYLRGRSIADTYMILDEAQNFSRNELLNILSRTGEGSKVVMLFDSHQVDNKFLQTGARAEIWSVIDQLKSSNLFAHVTLHRTERSAVAELASHILAR